MKNTQGFTLIETMISLVIFGIVMTGIYQTYDSQQATYVKQQQVIDMQQNQRTAIYFLGQEIRMAGYDPTGRTDADPTTSAINSPGFSLATVAELVLTQDLDGDGDIANDTNEILRYALSFECDEDRNGISDAITMGSSWINNGNECSLIKENVVLEDADGDPLDEDDTRSNGEQPVANDMDAVEFLYILDDGSVILSPDDDERVRIRSVIISTLVRTRNRIANYRNKNTYVPASNAKDDADQYIITDSQLSGTRPGVWGPFDDPYRRNLYVTRLKCRNMGRNPYADQR